MARANVYLILKNIRNGNNLYPKNNKQKKIKLVTILLNLLIHFKYLHMINHIKMELT